MPHVDIHLSTMGFRIAVTNKGEIKGTSLNIAEYAKKFEQWEKNKDTGSWALLSEFYHFDPDRECCYFPRYDVDNFKEFLKSKGVDSTEVVIPPTQGAPTPFYMLPHIDYKDDRQKNAIDYLVDENKGPIRALGLQTGAGKTTATIWGLQKLGVRSMTTMTSRLDQWVKEFVAKTTLEEDDIYVIAGVASLTKLFSQIDKINPKVILASAQTIRRYIDYAPSYQHLPPPAEMCEHLGIGVVGTDEYHEHFFTNFLIGIMLNPALFIPMTATFIANDPFTKEIFTKFMPEQVQFSGGEYKKYVNITAYSYNAGGPFIKPFHYMSPKGYSQVIFEKSLLSRLRQYLDRIIEEALFPIINDHYIRIAAPGEKFLFLCAKTEFCDYLVNVFKRKFKDKKIAAFHSGMPATILERYDMIFSTPGSAGTGRDIPNLRTCFAFESSFSEIRNLQFLGRLRDFPSVQNTPEFVYLQLRALPPHTNHAIKRSMLYGPRALTFKHRTI